MFNTYISSGAKVADVNNRNFFGIASLMLVTMDLLIFRQQLVG
jgi:hypothetical protein